MSWSRSLWPLNPSIVSRSIFTCRLIGFPRSCTTTSRAPRWIFRPNDVSDWKPTNMRAWSGLSAQCLKYSRTGPPDIMPDVARTMHGSGSSTMFDRISLVSTRLNSGDRNGFSPVWKICVRSWEFRYSGDAVHVLPELLARLVAARLEVVVAPVRRLHDQGLEARELVHGRIE